MVQFSALRSARQWGRSEYQDELRAIRLALVRQFNQMYGKDARNLGNWQRLCQTIGITPIPTTVVECIQVRTYVTHAWRPLTSHQVLHRTHVNLVDLIDCPRMDTPIHIFPNVVELAEYSMDNFKIFEKHRAAGNVLQELLRRIYHYGTQYRHATQDARQACQQY
jgi:hypothetical protein